MSGSMIPVEVFCLGRRTRVYIKKDTEVAARAKQEMA
jgi:hypothetical protein